MRFLLKYRNIKNNFIKFEYVGIYVILKKITEKEGAASVKIGEIAKMSGIPVETIRYYISLGLLDPLRKNGQYRFSQEDWSDLQRIQELKEMRFSLKEIETVIRFGRTSNWVEPEIWQEYRDILQKKAQELQDERQALHEAMHRISLELERVDSYKEQDAPPPSGVPLSALRLLVCPRCGRPLDIKGATFSRNSVMSGNISCPCGYHASIERGVLKTENRYLGSHDTPDLGRQLYSALCSELLRAYQSCSTYIMNELTRMDLRGKTVLESCINGYFFLYNHFGQLPRDCLYIVTDKYPEMLHMYKNFIDRLGLKLDILYIADNGADLPLADGCVDVCVDFFSSTEWSLYHPEPYPNALSRFWAPECRVAGSFMDVPPFSQTVKNLKLKYPEGSAELYNFAVLRSAWEKEGFVLESSLHSQIKKTQNSFCFSCHVDGEELSVYAFKARRRGG